MTSLNPSHNIFRQPEGRHAQAVHEPSSSSNDEKRFPDRFADDLGVDDTVERARRDGRDRVRRGMVPVPDLRFEQVSRALDVTRPRCGSTWSWRGAETRDRAVEAKADQAVLPSLYPTIPAPKAIPIRRGLARRCRGDSGVEIARVQCGRRRGVPLGAPGLGGLGGGELGHGARSGTSRCPSSQHYVSASDSLPLSPSLFGRSNLSEHLRHNLHRSAKPEPVLMATSSSRPCSKACSGASPASCYRRPPRPSGPRCTRRATCLGAGSRAGPGASWKGPARRAAERPWAGRGGASS